MPAVASFTTPFPYKDMIFARSVDIIDIADISPLIAIIFLARQRHIEDKSCEGLISIAVITALTRLPEATLSFSILLS